MNDSEERCLLEEYRANIELWKHDDTLRQQRMGNFLNVNSILLVTFCALISVKPSLVNLAVSSILLSIFGILISWAWYSVMLRNSDYISLRRFQLRSIEACFPCMTTFKNTYKALSKYEPTTFNCTNEVFQVSRKIFQVSRKRGSSTSTESNLPLVMSFFWLLVFCAGMISAALTLSGSPLFGE